MGPRSGHGAFIRGSRNGRWRCGAENFSDPAAYVVSAAAVVYAWRRKSTVVARHWHGARVAVIADRRDDDDDDVRAHLSIARARATNRDFVTLYIHCPLVSMDAWLILRFYGFKRILLACYWPTINRFVLRLLGCYFLIWISSARSTWFAAIPRVGPTRLFYLATSANGKQFKLRTIRRLPY